MNDPHGLAPLPPVPRHRSITPAPEDYRQRLRLGAALWPLVWFAVGVALVVQLGVWGWPLWTH